MNAYRTHNCGELRKADVTKNVMLAGWAETIRDHGGVIFIDLRDHYGTTQIVVNDEDIIKNVNRECVIKVSGTVRERSADTVNAKISTGEIEVKISAAEILGPSANLPFDIGESEKTREDVRLKYRFLDLRNPSVHERIVLHYEVMKFMRNKMDELGFIEIHTPILTASSPEGARDYIVPSRKHRGMFYALPQAPQMFKQLLMVSGFDKYFQIAPCFRDEDSRADRSPGEFYQLDFEMAFATQEEVFDTAESIMYPLFKKFSQKNVSPAPFKCIPYAECMLKYGSDKPDLRNPLVITDMSDFFKDADFAPFKNKPVRGIKAPGCADYPKSFFEKMLAYATEIGMKGLGNISMENSELKGPIVKFLSDDKRREIVENFGLIENDTMFFISDAPGEVDRLAGLIRAELGERLGLIDTESFELCFVTDFPMYGINEETGKIDFTHNPFSMPQGGMEALETKNPLDILAYQYDIVCNGVELSSGAVRNHSPEIMKKAFAIAGYSETELEERFGALYTAFQYGAPPHAGMAPGLDRIVMLISGEENLREVIAFPLNGNAMDVMLGAPGEVSDQQLREVHIKLR